MPIKPGNVVTCDFPGAARAKRRPAVVVSTDDYHKHRPDAILGLLTTQLTGATSPTDYVLNDWSAAGLHRPSAFRSFLFTIPVAQLVDIGRLSDRDWDEIRDRLLLSVSTP